MNFKNAGKRSFRREKKKKKKNGRQQTVDSSKQAGCHTTSYNSSRNTQKVGNQTTYRSLTSHVSVETLGAIRCFLIIGTFSGHGRY